MSDKVKYHINPETGRPNQCSAQTPEGCKYAHGDVIPQHYYSKEEARVGYENDKKNDGEFENALAGSSVKKTKKKLDAFSDQTHQEVGKERTMRLNNLENLMQREYGNEKAASVHKRAAEHLNKLYEAHVNGEISEDDLYDEASDYMMATYGDLAMAENVTQRMFVRMNLDIPDRDGAPRMSEVEQKGERMRSDIAIHGYHQKISDDGHDATIVTPNYLMNVNFKKHNNETSGRIEILGYDPYSSAVYVDTRNGANRAKISTKAFGSLNSSDSRKVAAGIHTAVVQSQMVADNAMGNMKDAKDVTEAYNLNLVRGMKDVKAFADTRKPVVSDAGDIESEDMGLGTKRYTQPVSVEGKQFIIEANPLGNKKMRYDMMDISKSGDADSSFYFMHTDINGKPEVVFTSTVGKISAPDEAMAQVKKIEDAADVADELQDLFQDFKKNVENLEK